MGFMTDSEQQLTECFRALDDNGQSALMAFAEFLLQRNGHIKSSSASLPEKCADVTAPPVVIPEVIPRKEGESVIGGIKRLVASYPMVDRNQLSKEIQSLMTQHVLKGVSADEVIDQLESLFLEQYQKLQLSSGTDS
jgi:hypothetical protein